MPNERMCAVLHTYAMYGNWQHPFARVLINPNNGIHGTIDKRQCELSEPAEARCTRGETGG